MLYYEGGSISISIDSAAKACSCILASLQKYRFDLGTRLTRAIEEACRNGDVALAMRYFGFDSAFRVNRTNKPYSLRIAPARTGKCAMFADIALPAVAEAVDHGCAMQFKDEKGSELEYRFLYGKHEVITKQIGRPAQPPAPTYVLVRKVMTHGQTGATIDKSHPIYSMEAAKEAFQHERSVWRKRLLTMCDGATADDLSETGNHAVWVVTCDKKPGYTISISIELAEHAARI